MYSNITFTEKQKENPLKLYDTLKSNGIIDKVILAMDEEEYNKFADRKKGIFAFFIFPTGTVSQLLRIQIGVRKVVSSTK